MLSGHSDPTAQQSLGPNTCLDIRAPSPVAHTGHGGGRAAHAAVSTGDSPGTVGSPRVVVVVVLLLLV